MQCKCKDAYVRGVYGVYTVDIFSVLSSAGSTKLYKQNWLRFLIIVKSLLSDSKYQNLSAYRNSKHRS